MRNRYIPTPLTRRRQDSKSLRLEIRHGSRVGNNKRATEDLEGWRKSLELRKSWLLHDHDLEESQACAL